jgi:hypothetical protein
LAWWPTIPFESFVHFIKRCMYLLGKHLKKTLVGFLSYLSQFIMPSAFHSLLLEQRHSMN